jgi:hypothetical protein
VAPFKNQATHWFRSLVVNGYTGVGNQTSHPRIARLDSTSNKRLFENPVSGRQLVEVRATLLGLSTAAEPGAPKNKPRLQRLGFAFKALIARHGKESDLVV